jgi:hypothetical protein
MRFTIAKSISIVIVLLISLRIFGATATALLPAFDHTGSIHTHETGVSTLFDTFLLEKLENENERAENENVGKIVLIDFSRLSFSLSSYHSPQSELWLNALQYDVRPPLHQLNCTFLI